MVTQMTMTHRLTAVAALMAFVVLFATPGGAACAWTGEAAHGCCADRVAEPTVQPESCCGGSTPVNPSPAPASNDGCDCLHAPTAPTAISVGTPTSPETAPVASPHTGESVVDGDTRQIHRTEDDRSRGGGHDPLIFLTHCAFLT